MGRRKSVMKIPETITLKCPHCLKNTRAKVSIENSPQRFTCPKCKQEVLNPLTSCCVICAFSKTKCPRNLYMEAKVKGLELR